MESIELGPFEFHDKLPLKTGFEAAGVRSCPARRRGGGRSSTVASSSCRATSTSGPVSEPTPWSTRGPPSGRAPRSAPVCTWRAGWGSAESSSRPTRPRSWSGDDANISSRCMVTQGARVGEGAVLAEGVILNPGIPVIDAATGEELGPGRGAAVERRRSGRRGAATYPGGEFFLPCVARHQTTGARRATRQGSARAGTARAPGRHLSLAGGAEMTDLLALTTELVAIPSVSHARARRGRPGGGRVASGRASRRAFVSTTPWWPAPSSAGPAAS